MITTVDSTSQSSNSPVPSSSMRYELDDFEAALRAVGITSGDLVFFQVCMDGLDPATAESDPEQTCTHLYRALRSVVGPQGTILAPAYTFSFCRGEAFDLDASPTIEGPWNTFTAFPEYLRRLPGAARSADPIFSTAGIGPQAAEILTGLPNVCLREGSVHDRLLRLGGKICIAGVGLYEAIFRHYVEALVRVPWRFTKLFTGVVREDGVERKEGWLYDVRIWAPNADPAGEAVEERARQTGICQTVGLGSGELLAVPAREFYDLAVRELARDCWSTVRGPAGDPVALEEERVQERSHAIQLRPGASPREIIEALWRVPRDIVSGGYDACLRALSQELPMTIHEYPTGTECCTWIVPEKWTCHEAWLETMDGRRLFSYSDHPLHVVSYSLPFESEVSREELFRHLHTHPKLRHAVPFIFKYYDRDWGLCCSQDLKESLIDERYRVVLRTSSSYGTLKVGEVVAPGETDDCVVLCAHLCHPAQVNDDLSGVAAGVEIMRRLLARKKRRYSYRFLIVPETIGSLAYLSSHEALVAKMKGGLFLEMLARPHAHGLQLSFSGETEVDHCFQLALREKDPAGWTGPFRRLILNDEVQFNAPGFRVPMLSLTRILPTGHPDWPFREYHSSDDTPETASFEHLSQSCDLALAMLDALEQNRVPVNRFKGEVFCSRYGLHIDWYSDPEGNSALFDIMHLVDGTLSTADIAWKLGCSFQSVKRTLDELERRNLIEYR
jgi:aminopeptidase-like protein/aminoglycoside N3'-acetyltransferase